MQITPFDFSGKTEADVESGFIYAIKHPNGKTKIGFSINPGQRIPTIESIGCFKAKQVFISEKTLFPRIVELFFHNKFKDRRVIGEWFSVDFKEVVSTIKDCWGNKEIREAIATAVEEEQKNNILLKDLANSIAEPINIGLKKIKSREIAEFLKLLNLEIFERTTKAMSEKIIFLESIISSYERAILSTGSEFNRQINLVRDYLHKQK